VQHLILKSENVVSIYNVGLLDLENFAVTPAFKPVYLICGSKLASVSSAVGTVFLPQSKISRNFLCPRGAPAKSTVFAKQTLKIREIVNRYSRLS
jgi:hypothetical protein